MRCIQREITVVDRTGNPLEATYPKRARQLVKKQRAAWVDAQTIRLVPCQHEEEDNMEQTLSMNIPAGAATETAEAQPAATQQGGKTPEQAATDEAIVKLAGERMAAKKTLWRQGLDLVILAVALLLIISFDDVSERLALGFLYGASWLIRYAARVVKFQRASTQRSGGFMAYAKNRKERQLQTEILRLRSILASQGEESKR